MNGCLGTVRSGLILLIAGSFAIALALMFWFTGRPPTATSPDKAPIAPPDAAQLRARIDSEVFRPYDRAQYPKLSAKLGDRWDEIQPLRAAAAIKALTHQGCTHVDVAEASVDHSSKENIRIFVYCDDALERHDFNESELNP